MLEDFSLFFSSQVAINQLLNIDFTNLIKFRFVPFSLRRRVRDEIIRQFDFE